MVDNQKYMTLLKFELSKAPFLIKKLKQTVFSLLEKESDDKTRVWLQDFFEEKIADLNFKFRKLIPQKTYSLLVIPAISFCNLNCQSCDAYAPLCSATFNNRIYASEQVGQDVKELYEKGFFFQEVSIEGGEPLLHPDILSFVSQIRKNIPLSVKVTLLTNGTLLRTFPTEFFLKLKELDCSLVIDKYYQSPELEEAFKILQQNDIPFELDGCTDGTGWFHRAPINLRDSVQDEDALDHFYFCEKANNIITLDTGYLYSCGRCASIKYFNSFFKKDLPDEGIDIYQNSSEEISKFLATPKNLCKYCLECTNIKMPWKESKQRIEEWAEI